MTRAKPVTVSICLIVRDEAETLLKCLQSIEVLADEIILVDTGSIDQTIELAEQFSPKVKIFRETWPDNFGMARNISLDFASGDWIFYLDADEILESAGISYLQRFFSQPPLELKGYMITQYNEGDIPEMDMQTPTVRIFPNDRCFRFHGRVHEQLYRTDGIPIERVMLPVVLRHGGHRQQVVHRQQKDSRFVWLENGLHDPLYNSPYFRYKYACGFLSQYPMDLDRALQEMEHSFNETLLHMENPPAPTWFAAPLDMVSLYICSILFWQNKYQLLIERFPEFQPWCRHADLVFIYARAFYLTGHFIKAQQMAHLCYSSQLQVLHPQAGYHTWQPLIILLDIAIKQRDIDMARTHLRRLLQYFPKGQVPGLGSLYPLQQLLEY